MDRLGRALVRADGWLWHLSNVLLGIAVLAATVLYAPPGSRSVALRVVSIDPFYLLLPASLLYTGWSLAGLYRWYGGDDIL